MLFTLLSSITLNGYTAMQQAYIPLKIMVPGEKLLNSDGEADAQKALLFNWDSKVKKAFRENFPEVKSRSDKKELNRLISSNSGYDVKQFYIKNVDAFNNERVIWITASDDVDQYLKGRFNTNISEEDRRLTDKQLKWIDDMRSEGLVKLKFNKNFFTSADSREPESSGILGAVVGSALTMFVTVLLSLPLAVMASIYLEYFARPGRLTDFIEVNINNLAAVPSIVYGLLALQILLATIQLPRSTPLVAGITLALMTLPRIIIPCRASLKAVPPSIREGALAVGASKFQSVFHHVVPLALPGTLSGTIIGLAQALGETAPLILIGMVAFVVDIPSSPVDPSSSLPVQVYLWSESAERGFVEKTSATIMMLLTFLIVMNFVAVYLRQKFEKRWN